VGRMSVERESLAGPGHAGFLRQLPVVGLHRA
jgi:hypothetical protein